MGRQSSAVIEWSHEAQVRDHVPSLRSPRDGNHADRRLQILLHLPWLWRNLDPEEGGLLRILLLRVGPVSADPRGVGRLLLEPITDPTCPTR